jgi:predicted nucleic acid-binding protein
MKIPCYVMDACALIALINREPGYEVVRDLLKKVEDGSAKVNMHAVNLCEVYYDCLRGSGSKVADALLKTIETMPLTIVVRIDAKLLKETGKIKATEKVSLADAFAVSLAVTLHAQLVTSDHHEFETLESKGTVRILWFR